MCGVNGENGESGADYGESSPRSWNGESWPDYIELFESSFQIRQVLSNCQCPWVMND